MKENKILKALQEKDFNLLKEMFNENQMEIIQYGLDNGLEPEKIALFANPEFSHCQMNQIYRGFQQGLTLEQVKLYAAKEFDVSQMCQIRFGFEQGLTMDEISEYTKPELSHKEMNTIRKRLVLKGLDPKQLTEQFCEDKSFSLLQKMEIFAGFKDGLSVGQMQQIANPSFHPSHIKWLRKHLTPYNGMSKRVLELCLQPGFKEAQLQEIQLGFMEGLPFEGVLSYADPKLSSSDMKKAREELLKSKKE